MITESAPEPSDQVFRRETNAGVSWLLSRVRDRSPYLSVRHLAVDRNVDAGDFLALGHVAYRRDCGSDNRVITDDFDL